MEMKGALKEVPFKFRPGGWGEIYVEVVVGSKEELIKAEGTASEENLRHSEELGTLG